jgi:TldD protein
VLPEFPQRHRRPADDHLRGQPLLGAYAVDDEGVPAQAVDVVVNGKLRTI